jgi:hypothetical protein
VEKESLHILFNSNRDLNVFLFRTGKMAESLFSIPHYDLIADAVAGVGFVEERPVEQRIASVGKVEIEPGLMGHRRGQQMLVAKAETTA